MRASTHLESAPRKDEAGNVIPTEGGDSVGAPSGRVVMQVNPLLEAAVEFVKTKLQ